MLSQEPVIQEVLHMRKSKVVRNLESQPLSETARSMIKMHNTGSLVVSPLFSRNEIMGTIWLEANDPERIFTTDDISLLDQIAIQTSTAIEVARFLQQTEKRAERERKITEITSKVRESTNIEIILQTALRELSDTLHVNRGSIQLRGGNGGSSND
jgi:GAF domain-containing protein